MVIDLRDMVARGSSYTRWIKELEIIKGLRHVPITKYYSARYLERLLRSYPGLIKTGYDIYTSDKTLGFRLKETYFCFHPDTVNKIIKRYMRKECMRLARVTLKEGKKS